MAAVLGCAPADLPLEVALHSLHEAFLAGRLMVYRSQSQVVPWLLMFGRTEVCEGPRTASTERRNRKLVRQHGALKKLPKRDHAHTFHTDTHGRL